MKKVSRLLRNGLNDSPVQRPPSGSSRKRQTDCLMCALSTTMSDTTTTHDFPYQYLFSLDTPEDLRKLDRSTLPAVSHEVREYLIDVLSKIGGHFGAGLGTVEIAVALHYVFNTPEDKIIWDVGHQAYPHKIL